jgi:hypothetical protein
MTKPLTVLTDAIERASSPLLEACSDDFWQQVLVFPGAIAEGGGRDYQAQTQSSLLRCGDASLRLLSQHVGINPPAESVTPGLVAGLRQADVNKTLIYLAEFYRRKGSAINEEYNFLFSPRQRTQHVAELRELGGRSNLKLRLFVKLALLFEKDHDSIVRTFYRHLWRTRPTSFEFESDRPLDAKLIAEVTKDAGVLAEELEQVTSGMEVRFIGAAQMGQLLDVLLFQREYKPIVRPDYRDSHKTLHGFGWLMVGLSRTARTVSLKNGGQDVADVIRNWFGERVKVDLQRTGLEAFKDYGPATVEEKLLGGYPENSRIRITKMRFRRSLAPSHSPITIESIFKGQQDIRHDLSWSRERGLVRIRSLSDVGGMVIRFSGKEAQVVSEVEHRGAVTFRLNNADLTEEETTDLCKTFQEDFGIPLNIRIDPQLLAMGDIEIFNYLLEADRKDQVVHYQLPALKKLEDLKILIVEPRTIRVCDNGICQLKDQPVEDDQLEECPACQHDLVQKRIEFLVPDEAVIRHTAGKIIGDGLGWKFSSQPSKFEGHDFFALADPTRPDTVVRVVFAKRVSTKLLELLDRSMQPVLVVHTAGQVEHAHLDVAGVAHVGFAYALAAASDAETLARFRIDCRDAIDRLQRKEQERVLRAARQSRQLLDAIPADYSGEQYEVEVFNLLRSLFPYTERWGGPNRPDGFCSLVHYDDLQLRNVEKHNWSYDAKFSTRQEGYDLDVGEKRKMFDYVRALMRQPYLQVQGNRLDAHVIISNNMLANAMQSSAEFLRKEHRLGKDHPELKLVFVLDGFIKTLYDSVRGHEGDFTRRWAYLQARLAWMMKQENEHGYVLLDNGSANDLVEWVLRQPVIDTPPDANMIREGLGDTMRG